MPDDNQIKCVAIIKQKASDENKYKLVIRWFLGSEGSRLPMPNDKFELKIKLNNSNRCLKEDGTFGLQGEDHVIAVAPKLSVMIDPPRKAENIPGAFSCKDQWMAAQRPTKPVDSTNMLQPTFKISDQTLNCLIVEGIPKTICEMLKSITQVFTKQEDFIDAVKAVIGDQNLNLYESLILQYSMIPTDEGFGICHLLSEAHDSRIQWRVAHLLHSKIAETLKTQKSRGLSHQFINSTDIAEDLAKNLAQFLVRGGPRPIDLPYYLLSAYQSLREETKSYNMVNKTGKDNILLSNKRKNVDIFSFGYNTLEESWQYAAIITEAIKDAAFREKLDTTIAEPTKVRQQLRLRGTQGGRLLDYWCFPSSISPCLEELRGRQYPASELIGLGLTIGNFSHDEIQRWIDTNENILVNITQAQVPMLSSETALEDSSFDKPGNYYELDLGDGPLDQDTYVIKKQDLISMLNDPNYQDSTYPPLPAEEALINYDLMQTNAGITDEEANKIGRQIGYKTGDGRVEILLKSKKRIFGTGQASLRALGFNVYGMWEQANTKSFFDDQTKQPTLEDLRPWLITRRYSYERDLKQAFSSTVIDNILANPPWQALLEMSSDDEWTDEEEMSKLLALGVEDTASAKLPNVTNPGYTTFALDIRAGMDSGFDGTTRKFVGWDTRGAIKSNWDIELTRDNSTAISSPQRYRFWVTTVDCFEQESVPFPVKTNDVDAGQITISYLFSPQRRAALLPPPDRDPADTTDPPVSKRGIRFNQAAKKLIVFWETPYLNETGKFNEHSDSNISPNVPLKRANKDDLFGTILVFRSRLLRKADDFELQILNRNIFLSEENQLFMTGENILILPQWEEELDNLLNKSGKKWELFKQDLNVLPGMTDSWSVEFDIDDPDRGYEYVALLSVAVSPGKMNFWAPNVVKTTTGLGRKVQIVSQKTEKDPYVLVSPYPRISETPAVSDAIRTNMYNIPNNEKPRGVKLSSELNFYATKPILPPPSISRDLVLLKLLTHSFKDGKTEVPKIEWDAPWSALNNSFTVDASTDTFMVDKHGYDNGTKVFFRATGSNSALPTPLVKGIGYYVVNTTQNTFQIAAEISNEHLVPIIDIKDIGSGILEVWANHEKVMLTTGQAAMIEKALIRTTNRVPSLLNQTISELPDLAAAKWILAANFSGGNLNQSPETVYRQNPLVGFRGLQQVSFTYTPFSDLQNPPKSTESEAIQFRIFNVHAPIEKDAADNYATVKGVGNLVGDKTYRLNILSDFVPLQPIEINKQPALVRIDRIGEGGEPNEEIPIFGVINDLKRIGDNIDIKIAFQPGSEPESPLPSSATIRIYMGQVIYSIQVESFDETKKYSLLMPVGGGHPEVFCWWISSVSAQGIENDHSSPDRPFVIKILNYSTIEPAPPRQLRIDVPTDGVEHMLDPVKYQNWLPLDAQNPPAAQGSPRLLVTWSPYEKSEGVNIAIERKQIKASQQDNLFRLTVDDLAPWLAIQSIEAAKEDDLLEQSWLNLIQDSWLMGEKVKVDESGSTENLFHINFDHDPPLAGDTGLKQITLGGVQRAAFIDYYKDPFYIGNTSNVKNTHYHMDSNWLYSYRLTSFVDLGSAASADPEWRYLKSRPTSWTEFFLPRTTPINVDTSLLASQDLTNYPIGPEIYFEFLANNIFLPALTTEMIDEVWRYRIVVRRKRNFTIRTSSAVVQDFGWEDVGHPVNLLPASGQKVSIIDDGIERSDITKIAEFTYQIIVNEFVSTNGGEEMLIRSQSNSDPFNITIPVSNNPDHGEVRMIKSIKIN